jgi:hypothetical protein
MNNKSETTMNNKLAVPDILSCLFGILFLAIGIINIFWGNDLWFGVFIVLLSFIFFPPVTGMFRTITGFTIPLVVKIILGIFILWAALGVGELFDKINLMMMDF